MFVINNSIMHFVANFKASLLPPRQTAGLRLPSGGSLLPSLPPYSHTYLLGSA